MPNLVGGKREMLAESRHVTSLWHSGSRKDAQSIRQSKEGEEKHLASLSRLFSPSLHHEQTTLTCICI
jgi:hypothetical protein